MTIVSRALRVISRQSIGEQYSGKEGRERVDVLLVDRAAVQVSSYRIYGLVSSSVTGSILRTASISHAVLGSHRALRGKGWVPAQSARSGDSLIRHVLGMSYDMLENQSLPRFGTVRR